MTRNELVEAIAQVLTEGDKRRKRMLPPGTVIGAMGGAALGREVHRRAFPTHRTLTGIQADIDWLQARAKAAKKLGYESPHMGIAARRIFRSNPKYLKDLARHHKGALIGAAAGAVAVPAAVYRMSKRKRSQQREDIEQAITRALAEGNMPQYETPFPKKGRSTRAAQLMTMAGVGSVLGSVVGAGVGINAGRATSKVARKLAPKVAGVARKAHASSSALLRRGRVGGRLRLASRGMARYGRSTFKAADWLGRAGLAIGPIAGATYYTAAMRDAQHFENNKRKRSQQREDIEQAIVRALTEGESFGTTLSKPINPLAVATKDVGEFYRYRVNQKLWNKIDRRKKK